jgi:hypothetical protein
MSIRGRWQVVETPGCDLALAGAYILFDQAGGEFAFDCLTGSIHGACHGDVVEFGWQGNDEMEPAEGAAGPNCTMTAHSKGRSVYSTATTSHSSRAVQRLLQQPVRASVPVRLLGMQISPLRSSAACKPFTNPEM